MALINTKVTFESSISMEKTSIYANSAKLLTLSTLPASCPHCQHSKSEIDRMTRDSTQKTLFLESVKSLIEPTQSNNPNAFFE